MKTKLVPEENGDSPAKSYTPQFATGGVYHVVQQMIECDNLSGANLEKAHLDLAEKARLFERGIRTVH